MDKIVLTTWILGGALSGGLIVDNQINPYIDKGEYYEMTVNDNKVLIDKDTAEFTLEKWQGEEAIKVKRLGDFETSDRDLLSKTRKIESSDGKEVVLVEPVENGTKIDILLKEKPNTNVFNLTLTGWENFSFFYQPPLNEDQGALSNDFVQSCSETECVDSEGNVVITRNEDIVDSYAVYHKFKKHHIVGQTDYKTGKAFHIYRPKIIDSKGSEVWAELSYNEGVLSVTVPQDFLDNANYPVRIDPTFGNTNVGGTEQAGLALDDIYGLVATTSDSATVDSITAYTALGGDRSFKGVMSTNVTAPLILTNGVGTGIIQNDDNWTTSTMSTPPSITAGTSYLIGWIADAQGGMWYDVGASGVSYRDTSNSYATPQDWGTRGARTEIWSIYATYTISSGGTFNNPQLNVGGEIFIHGDINIAN